MVFLDLIREYILISRLQIESFLYKTPPKEWGQGNKGDILLIHGFAETWVFLRVLGDFVNKLGYRVHVLPSLGRNFTSLETSTHLVKEVLEKQNFENLVIIGHSKGSLIAVTLLPLLPHSVKIITISTPYFGTYLGLLRLLSLSEMSRASKQLHTLITGIKHYEKIFNLYAKVDNHVIPNKNLRLEGAKNIQISVVGHTRILEARETRDVIKKILDNEL